MYVIPIEFGTPEYDQTVKLRDKILRKPLGLEFYPKDFATEYLDTHLACYNAHGQLMGCLILSPKEEGNIKMRQVAVDEHLQGKGIGRAMVEKSELLAKDMGFKKMVLNARALALPFYERMAYTKIGKPFTEVKVKHYKMEKDL